MSRSSAPWRPRRAACARDSAWASTWSSSWPRAMAEASRCSIRTEAARCSGSCSTNSSRRTCSRAVVRRQSEMRLPLFRTRVMARSSRKRPARTRDRVRELGRAETPVPGGGTENAPPDYRWTRFAILFAVAALTVVLAWRTESSRDFGYHLATGQWILEHRSWPRVDPFTYTLSGRPYIDMHGLFQIALALAYRGGMIGIGLLRVAFALATFAILWLSAGQRGVRSPALLGLGLLIALLTWEVRLMSRPELASSLCLAAQLYLLRRHVDSGERRFLFATVLLQLVWVYSHALSIFGIAVLGLYAATSLVGGPRRVVPVGSWVPNRTREPVRRLDLGADVPVFGKRGSIPRAQVFQDHADRYCHRGDGARTPDVILRPGRDWALRNVGGDAHAVCWPLRHRGAPRRARGRIRNGTLFRAVDTAPDHPRGDVCRRDRHVGPGVPVRADDLRGPLRPESVPDSLRLQRVACGVSCRHGQDVGRTCARRPGLQCDRARRLPRHAPRPDREDLHRRTPRGDGGGVLSRVLACDLGRGLG